MPVEGIDSGLRDALVRHAELHAGKLAATIRMCRESHGPEFLKDLSPAGHLELLAASALDEWHRAGIAEYLEPDLPTVDQALESGLRLHIAGTAVSEMPPTSASSRVFGVLCHSLAVTPFVPEAIVAVRDECQFLDRVPSSPGEIAALSHPTATEDPARDHSPRKRSRPLLPPRFGR